MASHFQNLDVYTFRLREAQDWLQIRGGESKGSNFPDAIRRVKDEEYANIMEDARKAGILPCNSFVSLWDPFQAIAENAELFAISQSASWVSYRQGSCSAWGLSAHVPCAAGVRLDLEFYGKTEEQLRQHVCVCIEHLASGQSFTDPKLTIHFSVYYPEQIGRFDCSEMSHMLRWKRLKWTEYKQYVCMQAGTYMSPFLPESHI